MHVLLIHQAFAGPGDPGGTRHFELGRYCVSQGHRFTVVASEVNYLTGRSAGDGSRDETHDGVRVLRARAMATLHRGFVMRLVSFVSFMISAVVSAWKAGRPDLVMGTSPPLFQAVSAWLVAFLRRRPFLLEIRDLWPEFAVDMGVLRNPLLIWLAHRLADFLYARADRIVVNSPAYREWLIEKGIDPDKVSIVANGVDVSMFEETEDGRALRDELSLGESFVVTYAGALGPANDIPTILRAAERLRARPGIRFLLIGDGAVREALQREASERGLDNVIFTGIRPKSEIPAALAASDACVATLQDIPMFTMTYPNKVFDYMAARRPTLLGIDGVIREVVEAAGGGIFVPPGNDAALASAVTELEGDRDRARRMGLAARDYVERHFDRREQARDFFALLERTAGAGGEQR
jgi:glycosyltransferase involved in cell wall biosynthesis